MFQLNYLITREHPDEFGGNFRIFVQESYFVQASFFP
jgi:hypothetical protein